MQLSSPLRVCMFPTVVGLVLYYKSLLLSSKGALHSVHLHFGTLK